MSFEECEAASRVLRYSYGVAIDKICGQKLDFVLYRNIIVYDRKKYRTDLGWNDQGRSKEMDIVGGTCLQRKILGRSSW